MTELLPKVGRYEFQTEPFHCDFTNHLAVGHLGNAMLNAADYHSNDRGYGMHYLNTVHKTWVLSRLAIEMERMPVAYDKVFVETWVDGAMKFFTNRNFAVTDAGGVAYGYGKSIWAMIDTDTRQPVDILSIHDGLISQYVDTEKPCPIDKCSRVKVDDGAELVRTIDTYYSDIDVNGHVNSIRYIDHVLDLFPTEWYRDHRLKRFDIAYVAETYQGDRLSFYREQMSDLEFAIRLVKTGKDSGDEVEVCRCKVVFLTN